MTSTNTYTDTKAVDYLEAIKRNQLESRNSKSSSSNFDMTYMLPRKSEIGVVTSFTNTEKTLGDYAITNNTAKQIVFLPFDYDIFDAINSNDGTITGTETYVSGPLITSTSAHRRAFSFNGSSYITLANESNFDFNRTDAFSVSFWIYVTLDTSGFDILAEDDSSIITESSVNIVLENYPLYVVFSKISSTTSSGYFLTFDAVTGLFNYKLQNSVSDLIDVVTQSSILSGWNHISITYSGSGAASGVLLYVNGTSVSLTTTSDTSTASILNNVSMIIGALGDATNKFIGYIDDFQIWNSVISSTDVGDLRAGKQLNKNSSVTNPAILGLSDVS